MFKNCSLEAFKTQTKSKNMQKIIFFLGVFLSCNIVAFSQPVQASEAQSGAIKVYTTNAYYVNAVNNSADRLVFSFNYDILTYKITHEAWSKFPVYNLLSTSSESYQNVSIDPNEQRSIFTAPVNSDNSVVNYIKITEIYNVRKP